MEKKVVYRIATIADYDREAFYLREMHAQGWKLRKVSYSILLFAVKYTFEKCQPEQVSYQLDFYPMKKSERASYLQLFKDCGWEHITNFNGFSYFRKAHSEIESDAEFEIYNDAQCGYFLSCFSLQLYYRFFQSSSVEVVISVGKCF